MKPVGEVCNCRCDYCYNMESPGRTPQGSQFMTPETVEKVILGLVEAGYDLITTTWHGGEPLLRGIPFYAGVVEIQKRIREQYPVIIKNGVQSNLTRLDERWCQFFKDNGFVVGASCDGWRELHDSHRKYGDGRGQFDDTMRGMNLARRFGILGGYIAVVTNETVAVDPREFFNFLMEVYPRAEITPCWGIEGGVPKPDYAVSNEQFLTFAKALFDVWWETNDPQKGIRLFHGFMQALLGGQEYTCSYRGNCGDFLGVEANGDVYPCGKFAGIPEFCMGNVHTKTMKEMLEGRVYQAFLTMRRDRPHQCVTCNWGAICNNGCTYERWLGGWRFSEVSPHCEVWDGLYAYVNAKISALRAAQAT